MEKHHENRILLILFVCLAFAGIAIAQDTVWIRQATLGLLEKTINQDTVSGVQGHIPYESMAAQRTASTSRMRGIRFQRRYHAEHVGQRGALPRGADAAC